MELVLRWKFLLDNLNCPRGDLDRHTLSLYVSFSLHAQDSTWLLFLAGSSLTPPWVGELSCVRTCGGNPCWEWEPLSCAFLCATRVLDSYLLMIKNLKPWVVMELVLRWKIFPDDLHCPLGDLDGHTLEQWVFFQRSTSLFFLSSITLAGTKNNVQRGDRAGLWTKVIAGHLNCALGELDGYSRNYYWKCS